MKNKITSKLYLFNTKKNKCFFAGAKPKKKSPQYYLQAQLKRSNFGRATAA
jgi:hypothetical protein